MGPSLKGAVIIINFPFSDLSNVKKRPALVLADWQSDDVVLCQITSIANKDEFAIELTETDFISGSVIKKGFFRPNNLFIADKRTLLDNAGFISQEKIKEVTASINRLITTNF